MDEVESETPPTYSTEDIALLKSIIADITSYLDKKLAVQDKLPLTVDPVITAKELEEKVQLANQRMVAVMTKHIRAQEERVTQEKINKAKKEGERRRTNEKKTRGESESDSKSENGEREKSEEVRAEKSEKRERKHDEL